MCPYLPWVRWPGASVASEDRSPGARARSETLRGTGTLALGQHMSPRTGTWEGGISGAERINLCEWTSVTIGPSIGTVFYGHSATSRRIVGSSSDDAMSGAGTQVR